MIKKIFELLKSKWKEGVIILLIGVIIPLSYKLVDMINNKTYWENQAQLKDEKIKTFENTKAKEKIVTKYIKGDVVEKIVYRDIVIEKDINKSTRSESKVILPINKKEWAVGIGYDVFNKDLFGQVSYTFFDLMYIGVEYPFLFDGVNRVRISAGLRF